jgi:hypothetical protein
MIRNLHVISEEIHTSYRQPIYSPARRSPRASAASRTSGSSMDRTLPARRLRLSELAPSMSMVLGELTPAVDRLVGEDSSADGW